MIDARKQQVYAALYLDGRPALPPSVMTPEELVARARGVLAGRPRLVATGSGAGICTDPFAAAGMGLEAAGIDVPSPGVIAREAGERIASGQADGIASLEPLYLRRTDAELTRDRRLDREC